MDILLYEQLCTFNRTMHTPVSVRAVGSTRHVSLSDSAQASWSINICTPYLWGVERDQILDPLKIKYQISDPQIIKYQISRVRK